MTIFYRDQAAASQSAADAASLANVRERSQRAADAWTLLADRSQRADAMRSEREGRVVAAPEDAMDHARG